MPIHRERAFRSLQGVSIFHVGESGETTCSALRKQMTPDAMQALAKAAGGQPGDCLLLAVGQESATVSWCRGGVALAGGEPVSKCSSCFGCLSNPPLGAAVLPWGHAMDVFLGPTVA